MINQSCTMPALSHTPVHCGLRAAPPNDRESPLRDRKGYNERSILCILGATHHILRADCEGQVQQAKRSNDDTGKDHGCTNASASETLLDDSTQRSAGLENSAIHWILQKKLSNRRRPGLHRGSEDQTLENLVGHPRQPTGVHVGNLALCLQLLQQPVPILH